jgi:hypothetical protein
LKIDIHAENVVIQTIRSHWRGLRSFVPPAFSKSNFTRAMKIIVNNATALIPGRAASYEIGPHDALHFEFRQNGLVVVNQAGVSQALAVLRISVPSFAQAIHYAVGYRPSRLVQISDRDRDQIELGLRRILQCQDTGKEYELSMPRSVDVAIDLTETGLRSAAEHAQNRAAYFDLLAGGKRPAAGIGMSDLRIAMPSDPA